MLTLIRRALPAAIVIAAIAAPIAAAAGAGTAYRRCARPLAS